MSLRHYSRPDVALREKPLLPIFWILFVPVVAFFGQEYYCMFRIAGKMSASQSLLNLIGRNLPTTLEACTAKGHLDVIKSRLETVVLMSACPVIVRFNEEILVRGRSTKA